MHFVILNGPPYSGKSTVARELSRYLSMRHVDNSIDSFAAPLRHFIAVAIGQQYATMAKDVPRAELSGYSVREVLIDMSEHYLKQRYGESVFGRWLYHRVGRIQPTPAFVICEGSGFEDEVLALGKNTLIVRVERTGHDFNEDSRKYLADPKYVLHNDNSLDNLWSEVQKLGNWLIRGDY
jgi:hypothetical protein